MHDAVPILNPWIIWKYHSVTSLQNTMAQLVQKNYVRTGQASPTAMFIVADDDFLPVLPALPHDYF